MTAAIFERRQQPARAGLVALRVSAAERQELERLARECKATISDVLRNALAHARQRPAETAANT